MSKFYTEKIEENEGLAFCKVETNIVLRQLFVSYNYKKLVWMIFF